jgi:hypothetical protein
MATWLEVESYLSSNYVVEKLDTSLIKLTFEVGDGRSQVVFVQGVLLDDDAASYVSFASPFARVGQISAEQLVNCMADNPIVGMSVFGGLYVMKNVAPLQNLDANEIEWPLTFVTGLADGLERSLGLGDYL